MVPDLDMLEFLRSYKMYYTSTMEQAYQLVTIIILDNGGGNYTSFPDDPTNPNYPAYQAWLDEGNVPQPFPTPA